MSYGGTENALRVLLIDDDPADRALVIAELKSVFADMDVDQVFDARGYEQAMGRESYSFVITDYHLKWTDGLKILRDIKARQEMTPVIMFTGTGNEEIAVEAMKIGLEDYVIKSPKHLTRLGASASQAVTRRRERETIVRIEQAIREVEQRYRTFIENFIGIVFRKDLDLRPLYMHGRVKEITGYSANEFLSRSPDWEEIVHPEDRTRMRMDQEMIIKVPGHSCEREYRLVRKDGKTRWVREVVQNVRAPNGHHDSIQGVIYDIDEKKAMEESLRKSERLAIVGRMASVVAHEMNNPLANVAACAGALKSRLEDLVAGESGQREVFEKYLEIITTEAMRCKIIMGDILGLVRKRPLRLEPVDVAEVVSVTVQLLGINEDSRGYSFEVRSEEGLPHVVADADQLRQALGILLNNAMEAMPAGGGKVTIACGLSAEKDGIEILVSDEGEGIPAHLRESIFEPFFTTKQHAKGTGLGLAIAESIVSGLGGKIGIHPSAGSGATFFIRLFHGAKAAKVGPAPGDEGP